MNIARLKTILAKRIDYLTTVRASAESLGDLTQVTEVDVEIAECQDTLNKLGTVE
jgi:hypothetical protein